MLYFHVCNSTHGLVAMTSAQHAEGRQFDPGRVYCLDVGTSARLGQDPDVRLLRSPQARPPVLTSRQQRCCSEPTPPADPSKIQMNLPAIPQLRGLMPQPSICAWGVLGLGRQTHARHLLCAGTIASTQAGLNRWPPAWWATVAAMM